MELFAGLRSQIKNLKDRLKALDTSKKTQKEVKEVVDALNALEERYAKEKAKRDEKRKLKETKNEKAPEEAKETVESSKETSKQESLVEKESDTKVEDDKVVMPKKEFVKEHEKLVKELEPIVEEKKEQAKELQEVKQAKFDIDSLVEPVRGIPGSKGKVMRHDKPEDLVYVMWHEGPLSKREQFGGYYPQDLRKVAEEPKPEHCPCWEDKSKYCPECKTQKTSDLKSNYMTMLQDLKDEHKEAIEKADYVWEARLQQKIKELEEKIQEMFGNEKTSDMIDHPSGTERLVVQDFTKTTDNYDGGEQDGKDSKSDYSDQWAQSNVRDLESAKGVPGSLFNIETAASVAARLESEVNTPFVKAHPSSLGDPEDVDVYFSISADPKESWSNGILENSRYGKFRVSNDGEVEQFSGAFAPKPQPTRFLRKRNVKSVDQLIQVLNAFLEQVNSTPKAASLETESKNKCVICQQEFDKWEDYNLHRLEHKKDLVKGPIKTSALKINVFNKEWVAEPVQKDASFGYDISSDGKKVMHIKPANGKEWSEAELKAAIQNELTAGFKQAKLTTKIAHLNESTKVVILATSKDKKQTKIASVEFGVRGWVPSQSLKIIGQVAQKVQHRGHSDPVLGSSATETLLDCADEGPIWVSSTELLDSNRPPATPESLSLEEAQKTNKQKQCKECKEFVDKDLISDGLCHDCFYNRERSVYGSKDCPDCHGNFTGAEGEKCPTCGRFSVTASVDDHTHDWGKWMEKNVGDTYCKICGVIKSKWEKENKEALKTALPPVIPNQRGYLDNPPPVDKKSSGCDQCNAAMINGVFCHETGCPNARKERDEEMGDEGNQEWELEASLNKIARVVHRSDGWHVLSEKGKNLGGPYKSKGEAVKRLRQVEYFKHHGSLKPFSKKEAAEKKTIDISNMDQDKIKKLIKEYESKGYATYTSSGKLTIQKKAEVLVDPYQALTDQVSNMRSRMESVKERLSTNPMPKEAEGGEHPLEKPAVKEHLEDLEMGLDLVENMFRDNPNVISNVEEMENLLKQVEQEVGIQTEPQAHEEAESEHAEVEKEANVAPGSCPRCGTDLVPGKEFCDTCKKEVKKEAAPIPEESPTSPVAPTPLAQDIRPTDEDNLEVPTQMPTSKTPPGTKWTWDAANGKFVIMTDPSQPGKNI